MNAAERGAHTGALFDKGDAASKIAATQNKVIKKRRNLVPSQI